MLDPARRAEWIGAVLTLVHAIDHAWQALATHARLSLNELITLEHLYFCGPASSPALRRRTGLTASAVTGLIDRLEQRELVRRVRPSDDRRVVMVELTESGGPYARSLFQPLLNLLERAVPSAAPPVLDQQLSTISHLADFFEHVASATPSLYQTPDPD
jgi:DNA-binding MarR family transcriptional regulator